MKQNNSKYMVLMLARVVVIVIALVSITLSGSSLITIRSLDTQKSTASQADTKLSLDVNLPVGSNGVADRLPFGSGKAIFYNIPAVFSLYNQNESRPITKITELRPSQNINLHSYERLTTAASISPKKAHEFTLVGAKPSGTS